MRKILHLLSLALLIILIAPSLWAATIQVNTQTDLFNDGSACSLRDAIESFNNVGVPLSGGCTNSSSDGFGTNDTILLPAGQYNLTLSGPPNNDNSSGDLDIEPTVVTPLTILGADPANPTATVIDGAQLNPRDRVLHVVGQFPSATFTPVILNSLTIQHGQTPDLGDFNANGGGIHVGTSGCLDLQNSVVRMNKAGDGATSGMGMLADGGSGGGISMFSIDNKPCNLHISNSLIEDNQAGNGSVHVNTSVGSGGRGGGILSFDTVTIENTTVRNNHAGNGADRTGTGFSGFGGPGGGLYLASSSINPLTSTITASTFNNNSAGDAGDSADLGGFGGNGGGIYFASVGASNTFILGNSTLSANAAGDGGDGGSKAGGSGGQGGGLFVESPIMSDDLDATLNNNTFADNSAGLGGGAGTPPGSDGSGGGLFVIPFQGFGSFAFSIANTILANNTVEATGTGPNCSAPGITDSGFNLETGTDCAFTGTGSKQNANPNLGPLQDNGGPTFTQALLAGSDALDMGNNTAAPGSGFPACEVVDQRGISRPQGSACDIGAFEAQTADLAVIKTVSSSEVEQGSTFQFTVTVTNNGPEAADFALVDDALPAGVSFVSATPTQGVCMEVSGAVSCDLGNIPVGGTVEIIIEVIASVSGTYTNTAIASFPGIDPDPSNDSSSVDFIIVGGDISGSGCALQQGNNQGAAGIVVFVFAGSLLMAGFRRSFKG